MLSASQPHGSGTNSLSAFAKSSHFLLLNAILRLTFSSRLTPPPSDPPSNAPWFFNRLRRYISSVLTYLHKYDGHLKEKKHLKWCASYCNRLRVYNILCYRSHHYCGVRYLLEIIETALFHHLNCLRHRISTSRQSASISVKSFPVR